MSDHIGRSWAGTDLEDCCPCPKQLCGLVARDNVVDECEQHPPTRAKTIRQSHTADDCPGRRVHPAGEGPAAYAARLRVMAEAAEEEKGYVSVGLFDALDDYRRAVQREYAHELAERIRVNARERHDRDFSDNRVFRLTGARWAADLIDSETAEETR
ncbi:hypothetical protein [Streptomyces sp. DH12]|uniref:hypothetical protein n=1 Tax=Streptomyces sp. DH12 TaxID=2857010 RepID=UPI001E454909|nr:hypothetical protein [Streptomyces sp. DH12]